MAFEKAKPSAGTSLRSSNPEILANWDQLQTAINNEHIFSGTSAGTQTGDHTPGSARVFFQDAEPATRIDGDSFLSTDLGSLWVDTNSSPDNQFNILTAVDPTWTPVSTEVIATLLAAARIFASTLGVTGDFAVNTDKFTVAAASGNTLVAGTLDVTGNIDPTTFETTNGGFLDEDNMASDSATKVASQQSIKAYVDGITDPTYSGGESHTFTGGLIFKHGEIVVSSNSTVEVTYGAAFPTEFISAQATLNTTNISLNEPAHARAKSGSNTTVLQVTNASPSTLDVYWQAWGR